MLCEIDSIIVFHLSKIWKAKFFIRASKAQYSGISKVALFQSANSS